MMNWIDRARYSRKSPSCLFFHQNPLNELERGCLLGDITTSAVGLPAFHPHSRPAELAPVGIGPTGAMVN